MATKGIDIHESKISIEEKYMVFELDAKATALMIPLAHIKDIDFEARTPAGAKSADNGTFYVKSLVALDAGTATGAATAPRAFASCCALLILLTLGLAIR